MATDYTSFVSFARRMIAESGRPMRFIRGSRTAQDSAKPWRAADSTATVEQDVSLVAFVAKRVIKDIDGRRIECDDMQALVAAGAGVPDLTGFDKIIDSTGNAVYKIESCEVIAPGGTVVLYILGLES